MDTREIVQDARLTPGACRVVLYVAAQGGGWQEVPHAEFAAVLNHPGEKRLRSDLKLAQEFGYLERKPGGRDHHDNYRVSPALAAGLNGNRVSADAGLKNRPAPRDTLNGHSPAPDDTLRGDSRGVSVEGGGDGGEAGEAGARGEISERSSEAMDRHGELLKGCRDSLRDYLAERVPTPTRQLGYVQRVAGWLQGTDRRIWEGKDGRPIPEERRTAVIADALNGLLAGEEGKMKRPVGDPDNLRTKITVLIAMQENPYRGRGGGNGSPPGDEDDFVPAELGG